jgi:hypothetical protein
VGRIVATAEKNPDLSDAVACRWAAEHYRTRADRADFTPTSAERARIARGEEILRDQLRSELE